jgi:hypothetical protein
MHCLCQVVCEFSLQQDVCKLKNCELQNLELRSLLYLCDTSTCYRYQVIGKSCQGASKVHLAPSKLGSDPWPKIWQAKLMKQISIYYLIFFDLFVCASSILKHLSYVILPQIGLSKFLTIPGVYMNKISRVIATAIAYFRRVYTR